MSLCMCAMLLSSQRIRNRRIAWHSNVLQKGNCETAPDPPHGKRYLSSDYVWMASNTPDQYSVDQQWSTASKNNCITERTYTKIAFDRCRSVLRVWMCGWRSAWCRFWTNWFRGIQMRFLYKGSSLNMCVFDKVASYFIRQACLPNSTDLVCENCLYTHQIQRIGSRRKQMPRSSFSYPLYRMRPSLVHTHTRLVNTLNLPNCSVSDVERSRILDSPMIFLMICLLT